MADLPILLALLAVAWSAWRRPWVGVLGLAFVGVMHPQGYATGWLRGAPVYLGLGIVVTLSAARQFIAARQRPAHFWDWRFAVAAMLAVHMILTTWLGINPLVGWESLGALAKIVPLQVLALVLIDDREKLRYFLMTIALSIAVVVLKGGYWAVVTLLENRVYGPPGSPYEDNNKFAVAAAMAIPLLALWFRQIDDRPMRWVLGGGICLSFAALLTTWSRGGLLCAVVVAALLALHARRKWLMLPLLFAGIGLVLVAMPGEWMARMQTLAAPETAGGSRLAVWRIGWSYAVQHPWFGGGLGGLIYLTQPTGRVMAWHSAYVEMAAEHGLLGLMLWCILLFGTIVNLSWIVWKTRGGRVPWLADQAAMLRASLAAYAVGAAFLSMAYWELLYLLLVAGMLTSRLARVELRQPPGG